MGIILNASKKIVGAIVKSSPVSQLIKNTSSDIVNKRAAAAYSNVLSKGLSMADAQRAANAVSAGGAYSVRGTELTIRGLKETVAPAMTTQTPSSTSGIIAASLGTKVLGPLTLADSLTAAMVPTITPGSTKENPVDPFAWIPDIPGTEIDDKIKKFIKEHPIISGGLGLLAVGATVAGVITLKKKKKKTAKKKSTKRKSTKRKSTKRKSTKRRKKSGYGSEAAYNRKGGKKVYKTKNGQPYIILASGKARFIKKSR